MAEYPIKNVEVIEREIQEMVDGSCEIITRLAVLHPSQPTVDTDSLDEVFEESIREVAETQGITHLGEFLGIDGSEHDLSSGWAECEVSFCYIFDPATMDDDELEEFRENVGEFAFEGMQTVPLGDRRSPRFSVFDYDAQQRENDYESEPEMAPEPPESRLVDSETDDGTECPVDGCGENVESRDELYDHCIDSHGFWDEEYEEVFV